MTRADRPAVVVADYLFRGDAEVARALLDSAGIPALIQADDEGGLNPGFFSEFRVRLLVNQDDVAAARAALRLRELVLRPAIRDAMFGHANWALPLEACGLLAGTGLPDDGGALVEMVFCLSNRAASPSRFTIDPREHFGAMRYAERCGWEILGSWHSHPGGDAVMSATDVELGPGAPWINVVVGSGRLSGDPIRAYLTHDGVVSELDVSAEAAPSGEPGPKVAA